MRGTVGARGGSPHRAEIATKNSVVSGMFWPPYRVNLPWTPSNVTPLVKNLEMVYATEWRRGTSRGNHLSILGHACSEDHFTLV